MNVTVVVPQSLSSALEGRQALELGLPPTATLGDLIETLFKLYPKLWGQQTSDRKGANTQLQLFLGEHALRELAQGRSGLREGQRLYLSWAPPRRLGQA